MMSLGDYLYMTASGSYTAVPENAECFSLGELREGVCQHGPPTVLRCGRHVGTL